MSVATPKSSTEGAVTLEMINELQQQVLDNNPIYQFLLSDVSSFETPRPLVLIPPADFNRLDLSPARMHVP